MSLIRNGYQVSTRFLGVLFSALLTLALFDPGAATAQELKQVKLAEKYIQGFMAAYGRHCEALLPAITMAEVHQRR